MTYVPEQQQGYISTEHGLRLFYTRLGNGPQVVVSPNGCWLEADLEPLIAPERTLFLFNTRGSGASDSVTESSQVEAGYELRDFDAVRRFLGADQVTLLGWSMYGTVVARYAAANPQYVNRLVMMCPGYIRSEAPYLDMQAVQQKATARIDPAGLQRLEDLKGEGLDVSDPEAYCKEHQRVYLARQMGKPEALAKMKSNPCAHENQWPRNLIAFLQKLPPQGQYDWRAVASSIKAPTLVIHGSEDLIPLESSAEWAEAIPNARLEVITGSGHYPHLEAPDTFFDLVDSFLKQT
jgi:pimeloyl-ACP methyl ester carboxylesterase